MTKWILEPGHTAASFRARHMMVTWVQGYIKDVHGSIEYNPEEGSDLSLSMEFDVQKLWTGEPQRDAHLLSEDFLANEKYPTISFTSISSERIGATDYKVVGELQIRGIKKEVEVHLQYLGKWKTPYWTDDGKVLYVTRVGFYGSTKLNRHDFKVDWNDKMENNGVVVGHEIQITLDIEGLHQGEMLKRP